MITVEDDKKDLNEDEQKELDKKLLELIRKADEADPDKGTLKGEGFRVYSSLEEALEARNKRLEEQKKRIAERKRLKKQSKEQDDSKD